MSLKSGEIMRAIIDAVQRRAEIISIAMSRPDKEGSVEETGHDDPVPGDELHIKLVLKIDE